MPATMLSVRQSVLEFSRQHGISVNGKGGIPLLSKGDWMHVADNWQDAKRELSKALREHQETGKSFPWALP